MLLHSVRITDREIESSYPQKRIEKSHESRLASIIMLWRNVWHVLRNGQDKNVVWKAMMSKYEAVGIYVSIFNNFCSLLFPVKLTKRLFGLGTLLETLKTKQRQ